MRLNISIYISLDQQELDIEINFSHNSGTICVFLRNWRHYEGLEKYNNEEIKIFDHFCDIETKCEANDILITIKKNNFENEQKDFLKQNKKYKYPKLDSFHELSEVVY